MADLAVTATSVQVPAGQGTVITGPAGATVTAGQALYYDAASSSWKLAQANSSTTYKLAGLAVTGGSSGQTIAIALPGTHITMTATGAAAGIGTWLSKTTAGGLAPEADLVATNFGVFAGVWTSATNFYFNPVNSNAQR